MFHVSTHRRQSIGVHGVRTPTVFGLVLSANIKKLIYSYENPQKLLLPELLLLAYALNRLSASALPQTPPLLGEASGNGRPTQDLDCQKPSSG